MNKVKNKYRIISKDINKVVIDSITEISPFVLERYFNKTKGEFTYGYIPFDIVLNTNENICIEEEVTQLHESYPLGINFEIEELSRNNEIIGKWSISRAVINKLSAGGFDGTFDNKFITINFTPSGIKFEKYGDLK